MSGILPFILRKIVSRVVVFFVILSVTFVIPRLLPGGAFAYLVENPNVPAELRESLIKEFGLDKPLWDQYVDFLRQFFTTGNLGLSFSRLQPVSKVIMEALPWTIALVTTSVVLAALIGVTLGAIAAYRRGSKFDSSMVSFVMFVRSMPSFWLGLVLLIVFGYYLGWAPLYGAYTYGATYSSTLEFIQDVLAHLWLPIFTLTLLMTTGYFMIMRNNMINVIGEDFIYVAKAKGLPNRVIVFKHALRPASLPVITALALDLGWSISGALLIEIVFSLPGVGKLLYDAVYMTDYPLLLGIVVYTSALTLTLVTLVEIMYAYIDPRVRLK
ncbi:MAG: ABC transporter permease [Desulfurococcales archaeon]|nr:ABC transporter permease [Desulfurococcales archaeon]